MKQLLIALLCCAYILSCSPQRHGERQKKESFYDTIFVSYQEGIYETSAATTCSQMKEWSVDEDVSEVFVIDKDSYDAICSYLTTVNDNNTTREGCEARLYVQVSAYEMCIGDLGCACDVNDNGIPTDNYALYLIRSLSGYYNYLDSLDLQHDILINEFGIPSNYQKRIYPKLAVKGSPDEYGAREIVELVKDKKGEYVEESDYDDFRKVALVREQ